jgi:ComF family protein
MEINLVAKKIFHSICDLAAPKYCFLCNKPIDNHFHLSYICPDCFYNLPSASDSNIIISRLLQSFSADDIGVSDIFSLFSLKDTDFLKIIHSLKYEGLYNIGFEFGLLLGQKIKEKNSTNYDYILPVPIHSAKKRERGYNQSFHIARGINSILKTEINEKLVIRGKYTQSQTLLKAAQRKENVKDIYQANPTKFNLDNKTVLIVDDVFTTGSTINYLSLTLLNNGVKKVDAATIALA